MRTLITCVVATVMAGTIVMERLGFAQSERQAQPRPLKHRTGVALATVIEPLASQGVQVVVVEKDQTPGLFVEPWPPGTPDLEFHSSLSPIVILARVTGLEPGLNSPSADWVVTTVRAQVLDIPKKPADDPLAAKDRIEFTQDGGEVRIGNTTVRAVLAYAEGFEIGQRYLLFGLRNSADSRLMFGQTGSYRIGSKTELVPLTKAGPRLASAGVRLDEALKRIGKSKVKSQK